MTAGPSSGGGDALAVTLATLAEAAVPPDLERAEAARAGLDAAGLLASTGELAGLAAWWAGVRGDERAAPARTVVHVSSSGTRPAVEFPPSVRRVAVPAASQGADALASGARLADELADSATDVVLLSLADPLPSRVLAAHLLGLDPVHANGWPQQGGTDDASWMRQAGDIRDRLRALRSVHGDQDAMLAALRAPEHAAATGFLLRCAARRTPVLLDGPGAAGAALLAQRTAPVVARWWRAAHLAPHPLHSRLLTTLNLEPLVDLRIAAEDGTGALLGLAVLDLAAQLLAVALSTAPGPGAVEGPPW